jgi:cbb3-type cytochrome oxidase maturation protein
MSVLILLLIASLSVAILFLVAFLWSVKNRQFEDNFSPPRRILFEEPPFSTGPDEQTDIKKSETKFVCK